MNKIVEKVLDENDRKTFDGVENLVNEYYIKLRKSKSTEEENNNVVINIDSTHDKDLYIKIQKKSSIIEFMRIMMVKILLFYLSANDTDILQADIKPFSLKRNNEEGGKDLIKGIVIKFTIPNNNNKKKKSYTYNCNIELGKVKNGEFEEKYDELLIELEKCIDSLRSFIGVNTDIGNDESLNKNLSKCRKTIHPIIIYLKNKKAPIV